ncbi:MAG: phosphoribosylglycinamide formyltransferase [Aquificae bacterium]|nr:phosphoribosylglycinamide formyltransferase [Aquificota bacterium]
MCKSIVVLASGRGSNFKAIAQAVKEGKIKASIKLVISNKKGANVLDLAEKFGIPAEFVDPSLFSSREEYDSFLVERIKKVNPDLILLAGYLRILSQPFLKAFKGKILNIHPSLTPAFRGLNAQKQAIQFGAKYSGCTVHFVGEELDYGEVIIQAVVPITPQDTPETLSEKILKWEHRIYPQAVKWFCEDRIKVNGRQVIVLNAKYGTLPTNPQLEDF